MIFLYRWPTSTFSDSFTAVLTTGVLSSQAVYHTSTTNNMTSMPLHVHSHTHVHCPDSSSSCAQTSLQPCTCSVTEHLPSNAVYCNTLADVRNIQSNSTSSARHQLSGHIIHLPAVHHTPHTLQAASYLAPVCSRTGHMQSIQYAQPIHCCPSACARHHFAAPHCNASVAARTQPVLEAAAQTATNPGDRHNRCTVTINQHRTAAGSTCTTSGCGWDSGDSSGSDARKAS